MHSGVRYAVVVVVEFQGILERRNPLSKSQIANRKSQNRKITLYSVAGVPLPRPRNQTLRHVEVFLRESIII